MCESVDPKYLAALAVYAVIEWYLGKKKPGSLMGLIAMVALAAVALIFERIKNGRDKS